MDWTVCGLHAKILINGINTLQTEMKSKYGSERGVNIFVSIESVVANSRICAIDSIAYDKLANYLKVDFRWIYIEFLMYCTSGYWDFCITFFEKYFSGSICFDFSVWMLFVFLVK